MSRGLCALRALPAAKEQRAGTASELNPPRGAADKVKVHEELCNQTWGPAPNGPRGSAKFVINPMKEHETRLTRAPKCGARTRAGTPCQRLAIRGRRRCRLHGGLSTGAPRGAKNGNFRNGDWTAEAIEERKWLRSLVRSFAKTGTTE